MAYNFLLKMKTAPKYMTLDGSLLNNVYIDHVAKADNTPLLTGTFTWTSYESPTLIENGYSKPIKLYNSYAGRFLASTEQIQQIGSTSNIGEILGTLQSGSADMALEFVFQASNGYYKIWLSEDEDPTKNKRIVFYDKAQSNRMVLTTYQPNNTSTEMDYYWSVKDPII